MILPQDFAKEWMATGDTLVRFRREALEGVGVPPETRQFLVEAGLPDSAAPFLCFTSPDSGSLPVIAEIGHLPEEFRRFREIGDNGSGDPICIDEERNGAVVYLNHDSNFLRVFINSSVSQFAESLLAYRAFVIKTHEQMGEGAYLEGNASPELVLWLEAELRKIDAEAFQEEGFWSEELYGLRYDAGLC